MSALATYLVGALIYYEHFWIATTLSVASLLLLELKTVLEKFATKAAPQEILTFAKFLLLTAVILPALPNQQFGRFHINPFKTWLVVVAVSAISYGSYISAEADQAAWRGGSGRAPGRGVFLDCNHGGDVAPGGARGAPASFRRQHSDGVGHDVSEAGRTAGPV